MLLVAVWINKPAPFTRKPVCSLLQADRAFDDYEIFNVLGLSSKVAAVSRSIDSQLDGGAGVCVGWGQ